MELQTQNYRDRLYSQYISAGPTTQRAEGEPFASQAPYLRALVRRHFPPNREARVIDLGCGSGGLIHFARQAGYRDVSGIDYSLEQVRAAAELGVPGVVQGDLMDELGRLAPESVDVVLALDVIEHFTRDELVRFVDEVGRVLRPGGRWIIHTVNAEAPFFGRIRYGDMTHEMGYTQRSLRQLMLASGFRRVDCFEDHPVIHGAASAVRHVLWRGIRLACRAYLAVETGSTAREGIFTQNLLAVVTK